MKRSMRTVVAAGTAGIRPGVAVFCFLMWISAGLAGAEKERRANLFFAFDNGVGRGKWMPQEQARTLKELGYDGIGYTGTKNLLERFKACDSQGLRVFSLYLPCHPGNEVPFSPQLAEAVKQLEGTGTMLWLTVQGRSSDMEAVRVIREISDIAGRHGIKVALYPHHGFYVATARDAVRLVKQVGRPNVGVSINLCHELRAGNVDRLGEIIEEAAPHLFLVSINGADREGGWDKLIRTLDQGEFDVPGFLRKLAAVGYTGPVGLQCYNLKGDQRENLEISMKAWRNHLSSDDRSRGQLQVPEK